MCSYLRKVALIWTDLREPWLYISDSFILFYHIFSLFIYSSKIAPKVNFTSYLITADIIFCTQKERPSSFSQKREQTNTATWSSLFKVMITSLCRHLIQTGFYVAHSGHSFSNNTYLKFEVMPHLVSGLQKSRPTPRTSFTLALSIPEILAPGAFLASVAASEGVWYTASAADTFTYRYYGCSLACQNLLRGNSYPDLWEKLFPLKFGCIIDSQCNLRNADARKLELQEWENITQKKLKLNNSDHLQLWNTSYHLLCSY